jgi:hypothetical protein
MLYLNGTIVPTTYEASWYHIMGQGGVALETIAS